VGRLRQRAATRCRKTSYRRRLKNAGGASAELHVSPPKPGRLQSATLHQPNNGPDMSNGANAPTYEITLHLRANFRS